MQEIVTQQRILRDHGEAVKDSDDDTDKVKLLPLLTRLESDSRRNIKKILPNDAAE